MGWFANGSLVSGIRAVFRNQTCAHALMRARVCMMMSVQLGQVICSIDARNVARRCVFSISDRYLSILQDIMRSLGRPQGAFGALLDGPHVSFIPWFEVIDPPTESPTQSSKGKRRASVSPSPSSPTPAKRPRYELQVEEEETKPTTDAISIIVACLRRT